MHRNRHLILTAVAVAASALSVTTQVRASDPPAKQFGMEYRGGKGSLSDPIWFRGTLDKFDQRSYKFSKRITCMKLGYQYIIKVKSYDFSPRLFLREFDEKIVARGKIDTYVETVDGTDWKVHESELRWTPTHDEYILDISHYGDETEGDRAFSLFVYKLPVGSPWGSGAPDFGSSK